jgi:hypothetical protein
MGLGNEPGTLIVCQELPSISTTSDDTAKVVLTMGYDPVSPIALAATPVLMLDNWMALQVLLPLALKAKGHRPGKTK